MFIDPAMPTVLTSVFVDLTRESGDAPWVWGYDGAPAGDDTLSLITDDDPTKLCVAITNDPVVGFEAVDCSEPLSAGCYLHDLRDF